MSKPVERSDAGLAASDLTTTPSANTAPLGQGGNAGGFDPTRRGDIDLRIGRDGTWFYHGSPIGRKPLVKLFASVLQRDQTGDYWLVTPAERARITVDDVPFIAVALEVAGSGETQCLTVRTNVDDLIEVGPAHRLRVEIDPRSGEPAPYVVVRAGLEARLARSVFYQLVDTAVEAPVPGWLAVWSGGMLFPLGGIEPEVRTLEPEVRDS